MKLLLAIETSSQHASVCLFEENKFLEEVENDNPKTHSEFIVPAIQSLLARHCLKINQLSHLIVDHGPGSFTGIRLGLTVAKSFCFALKIPVQQKNSLETLAHQAFHQGSKMTLAAINAQRNALFFGLYSEKQILIPPTLGSFDQMLARIQAIRSNVHGPITVVGNGFLEFSKDFEKHLNIFSGAKEFSDFPKSSCLAKLADNSWTKDWNLIHPLYLRPSSAEENSRT